MLKGVIIIGLLGLIVTVGAVGVLPYLGSGSDGCCGPSAAPNPASTGAGISALTTETAGQAACCSEKPKSDLPMAGCCAKPVAAVQHSDSARQIVFEVEGLTCPAVDGLGCGHRIGPVLARLNKVEGVEKSFANRTGTMLRISVTPSADRSTVAAAVGDDLSKDNRKPVLLAGDEFKQSLAKEEWSSPGDLSAIEFHTLALHRVKAFAEAETLDKAASSKLVTIAEQQWERMAKGVDCCGKVKQPADWLAQFKQFATSVPNEAKELLSTEQAERLRQVLTKPFEEKDMPIAADAKHKE